MDHARRQARGRTASTVAGTSIVGSRERWSCRTPQTVVAIVTLSVLGRAAAAQSFSATHELAFAGASTGAICTALPTIGTEARLDGAFGVLAADVAAGTDQDRTPRLHGSAQAALRTPEWLGWSLHSNARWSSPDAVACGLRSQERGAGVAASFRMGAGGVWLGYHWRAGDPALRPASPRGIAAGAWRALAAFVMSVSVGTQPDTGTRMAFSTREVVRVDSFFNDTLQLWETFQHNTTVVDTAVSRWRSALDSRARIVWSHGRWSADGTLGVLWGRKDASAAPWGTLETSFALTPRLAVVGGFVAAPRRGLLLDPGRRVATLGFRVAPGPAAPHRSSPERPPPRGFEARTGEHGEIVLALQAPNAHYVEIAGDFTTWEARRMRRALGGWWELPVRLPPGRYQVNVRVDGVRWLPPPGLPAAQDEFGGRVGVLVVP